MTAARPTRSVLYHFFVMPMIGFAASCLQTVTPFANDVATADSPASMVPTPRPIAPISLGDVTLRRPTLRWELPPNTDGAEVQLCADRACLSVIERLHVLGTTARPMNALPARSVVFWRLRALREGMIRSEFSAPWLFHVPAVDNANNVDTSHTPHLDLNGDGFDDVVVGAPNASTMGDRREGAASVYYGGVMGISRVPSLVLHGATPQEEFGVSVASAGDLNGDGFAELLVGAELGEGPGRPNCGRVAIYAGGAAGIAATPVTILYGAQARERFGFSATSAGDVNRDGYADIVIGAESASHEGMNEVGAAAIYHGSALGISAEPARVVYGVGPLDYLGRSVTGAGDVNGDGYSDVAIGAYNSSPSGLLRAGSVLLFHGSPTGIGAMPTRTLYGSVQNQALGMKVASAGDVNNDGFCDLVVGGSMESGRRTGAALIYHGSATSLALVPDRTLEGPRANEWFGTAVAGAGDINGDGFADVVIGSYSASFGAVRSAGTASIYYGSPTGVPLMPALVVSSNIMSDQYGFSVMSAGDLNRDGFREVIVGALSADPGGRQSAGTASIFHGSANGISASPTLVLEGAAAGDAFGFSVAQLCRRSPHTTRGYL